MEDSNGRVSQRGRINRAIFRPLAAFLQTEASSGIVLFVAAAAALAWANSPVSGSYARLWQFELTLGIGSWDISTDLRHWVNDALMAIFFFVVGLEIKRELTTGELRDRRAAALPVFAALGGMVVPAAIYAAINAGGSGGRGWAIPMATDIAFAVGVLTLLNRRAPAGLKIFLLSIAIVDDIGAIVVIAIFYADGLSPAALATAGGLIATILACRRLGLRSAPIYIALGIGVWIATYTSGVHATIAGVALGFATPARPRPGRSAPSMEPPALDRIEHALHPWTSFLIVPLFALANAGLDLSGSPAIDRVTLGVVAGLLIGKTAGISVASWAATRLGVAHLPAGVRWRHVVGCAAVAGIGFTVSLLIAGLAFADEALLASAKLGILAGSLVAGLLGAAILSLPRSASPDR